MEWSQAFGKAIYYVVAHIVLVVSVVALWGVGAVLVNAGTMLPGGALILAGLVVAVIGGPAIWIKVIGDTVTDALASGATPRGFDASPVPVPIPQGLQQMGAQELVNMAEGLGLTFGIPGPGRVSVDYMAATSPVPPDLMAALRTRRPETFVILNQRGN